MTETQQQPVDLKTAALRNLEQALLRVGEAAEEAVDAGASQGEVMLLMQRILMPGS
jgi:hypothetical protein